MSKNKNLTTEPVPILAGPFGSGPVITNTPFSEHQYRQGLSNDNKQIPASQFNWFLNYLDTFRQQVQEQGILQWNQYYAYTALTSYTTGSDGYIYQALKDNNNVNPVGDTTKTWIKYSPGGDTTNSQTFTITKAMVSSTTFKVTLTHHLATTNILWSLKNSSSLACYPDISTPDDKTVVIDFTYIYDIWTGPYDLLLTGSTQVILPPVTGGVLSVNTIGPTGGAGNVTLTTDNVPATTTNLYMTSGEKTLIPGITTNMNNLADFGKGTTKGFIPTSTGNAFEVEWKAPTGGGGGVPTRMICYQLEGSPTISGHADEVFYITGSSGTYDPVSRNVESIFGYAVGGASYVNNNGGNGGGTAKFFIPKVIDTFSFTVGAGVKTSGSAAGGSTSLSTRTRVGVGPKVFVAGGSKTSNLGGGAVISGTGVLGYTGQGTGTPDSWGGGAGLGLTGLSAGVIGLGRNFPGGGAYKGKYADFSGNGCIWLFEYGGSDPQTKESIPLDIKVNGKKYANVLESEYTDQWIEVGEFIDYDPTNYFPPGVFIECPLDCISGWYYNKQYGFTEAPNGPLEYYTWNNSNKTWTPNISKQSELIDTIKSLYKEQLMTEDIKVPYIPTNPSKLKSDDSSTYYTLFDNEGLSYFNNIIESKTTSIDWLVYKDNSGNNGTSNIPYLQKLSLADAIDLHSIAMNTIITNVNTYTNNILALYSMSMLELINLYLQLDSEEE